MRFIKLITDALIMALSVTILLGCSVTADESGKMPTTTTSTKAKQLYLQGRDLQEKLRAVEARNYFQQAIAEDPDFAIAHLNIAFAATSAKEFFDELEKAVASADKASEGERLWILGFQAGVNAEPVKQQEYFTKLAQMFPKDERAHNILGGYYFGQQDWQKSIDAYRKAIEINADFSQPYNQMGYAYRFLEKYDDAEKAFKKYIEVIPDDPNPYDSYAELLMKIGRYDESIENYKKALGVNPRFVASHIGIATDYDFKGDGDASRKQSQYFYDHAEDDGQRRGALFAKTLSYVFESNSEKALATLQDMYKIAESINDAAAMSGDLGTMGNILVEFGMPDKAMGKFEMSLKMILDSNLSQEQKDLAKQFHDFNIVQVAVKKNEFEKAKKHAALFQEKAEAKQNKLQIMQSHQLLGMIALAEKKYGQALAELNQANPQNPQNIHRIGLAYAGKGDQDKAQGYFNKAKNFNALNNLLQAFVFASSKEMLTSK